ncbi:MAG TPA: efflux RND transporter periplasmic adaptor subunit [Treponema sp.]|nr:efflux RND transporter periplasmic adaptor subunit [Treponema sp.]
MKNNNKRKFFLVLFIIIGIGACIAVYSRDKTSKMDAEELLPEIITVTAEYTKYLDEIRSFGTVSWLTKHDITAQVAGVLETFNVRDGDRISKGETVAELKNIQLEIHREQCKNAVSTAIIGRDIALVQSWETKLGLENKMIFYEQSEISLQQKKRELANSKNFFNIQKELAALGGVTENTIKENELMVFSLAAQVQSMEHDLQIASLGLRDSDLIENQIIPADDFDDRRKQILFLNSRRAQAQVASSETILENAERELYSSDRLVEELKLKSPITGIVGARYYERGEYIRENEKVLTVIDTHTAVAVFPVQESDISFYSIGKSIRLEIPSVNKVIMTEVSEISPMADPGSGSFSVKAEFENSSGELMPGMFLHCVINRHEPKDLITIPETAMLYSDQKETCVFCVVNGIAVRRKISIQNKRDGLLWISEGLPEGEIIIDCPSLCIREGQYVQ